MCSYTLILVSSRAQCHMKACIFTKVGLIVMVFRAIIARTYREIEDGLVRTWLGRDIPKCKHLVSYHMTVKGYVCDF